VYEGVEDVCEALQSLDHPAGAAAAREDARPIKATAVVVLESIMNKILNQRLNIGKVKESQRK